LFIKEFIGHKDKKKEEQATETEKNHYKYIKIPSILSFNYEL
jgi:hypothetical protein